MIRRSITVLIQISLLYSLIMALILHPTWKSDAQSQAQGGMIMPMAEPPGPSTWLLGQPYGNTTGAYRLSTIFYEAGQGLHFGLDFPMPCGTELIAVADGEVVGVDNLARGAGPHNLLIDHPALGVVTLYGHLLERPNLNLNQPVRQGQVVALSGDPDGTCTSRPHLHFEVRARDYRTAYNPIAYIPANWNMLSSIGSFSYPLFQQDLYNPRQWMTLFDQPDVAFGGRLLNRYSATFPPAFDQRPPNSAPPARQLEPLPPNSEWRLRRVTYDGCCAVFWFHPTDPDRLYVIDGTAGTLAGVIEWDVTNSSPIAVVETAPPSYTSAGGTWRLRLNGLMTQLENVETGQIVSVNTGGNLPALNANNTQLMWMNQAYPTAPGEPPAPITIWLNDLSGNNGRLLREQRGGGASWIDSTRILLNTPVENTRERIYEVWTLTDNSVYTLGRFDNIRNVSIAPGGSYMMYYLTFQEDSTQDGIYALPIEAGALPQKMAWFGSWQWRDSQSVYLFPFDPNTDFFTLAYYELNTGRYETLVSPEDLLFTPLNGAWDVSADGRRIVFQSAFDQALYVLEQVG